MIEKTNKLVVGISGYARSGKDTLASIIKNELISRGVMAKTFSFAYALKSDIDDFCITKVGISAFSEDTCLKSKIRPILIAYGAVQRKISNGTYWLNKLKPEIDQYLDSAGDVAIISDLRFKEFEYDEVDMIKSYKNNLTITISRIMENGLLNIAAHESEFENLPRISRLADYELTWNTNENKNELKKQSAELVNLILLRINKL